jgi:molybdate transport system substrate-binding protein
LVRIAEDFHRDTGHEIKFVFGLSPVIHKMAIEGESADLIIIQPDFVDELINAGKVAQGKHPVIARVGIGLFARSGASTSEISTPRALRQALIEADMVAFSNVASGNHFATVLDRLGLSDEIKGKIIRANPAEVVARVLQGKGRDVGVGTLTQIVKDKRLKLIGPLPSDLQNYLVYSAARMANAPSPEVAREFVRFLEIPQSRREFIESGAN